ncbi:MAG TPA: enolase C-terminal domain-like protein [Gaiellaceae bacterium]
MATAPAGVDAAVAELRASVYTVPTDAHESDGTLEWDETTLVLVEATSGDETGIGWTYSTPAAAKVVEGELAGVVVGESALDVRGLNLAMRRKLRNAGYPGIGSAAVSAVDVALWDLKARLLELPLVTLLGAAHESVPVYGSGGFCSYSDRQLSEQLAGWVDEGIPRVKMKVGREPERDLERVRVARLAVGDETELYVDANGAFNAERALRWAEAYASWGVMWFEEPVSSNDVDGLRLVRSRSPAGMDIAAGEYAYTPDAFRALAGAVDCLQADVTRCGGITGLLGAAAVAEAFELDLSGHTAPSIHAHVLCAAPKLRHLEWFHDHVRIERMFFDGFLEPAGGAVHPDRSRPGLGVDLKRADAERYVA